MIFGKGVTELCDQWRFRVRSAVFTESALHSFGDMGTGGLDFVEIGEGWSEGRFRKASQLQRTKWVSGCTADAIRRRTPR